MSPRLCCADTPVRERREAGTDNVRGNAILAVVRGSFGLFVAALREIFDESAYQRFLDRSQLESSVNAYAAFLRENDQAKSRRPRCC
jgi:hypothetical protein